MWEALQFGFMQNALMAGVLTSISCGIIGSLIVVNRMVFISGGIAHAAFGGIGLAVFLGFAPSLGAALFAVGVSLIMGAISLKSKHRADTIIGVLWAVGMALGIILIDVTPGYHADLMSYLFGSILAVTRMDLWLMSALDGIVVVIVLGLYKEFVAMSYDEDFAFVVGVPVTPLYFALLGLTALSIVMIIRIVGLILVIALLTIPPYIAEKFTHSLRKMMVVSASLGTCFTLIGLIVSYYYNLTSGPAIIMTAGLAFLTIEVIAVIRGKRYAGPRGQ
ncbi:MAG: metal ABC transporter permease [Deltaproteobacteria bacterium]|nr:metal ABC transporter permease [Deltaproteobacteria bacterium]